MEPVQKNHGKRQKYSFFSDTQITVFTSVAEPVHFCAAPAQAPACQKFPLRLQLGPFSRYNLEKFNDFHGFKKFSCFLETSK
jgi:hypothetical protein